MDGIVCTNQWKIEQCKNKFGIAAHRLTLARNGFDPIFLTRKDKQEVRRQLDLPIDKKIVLYTGHLYDWKGVDVLAEAGKKLSDVLFVFVGGTADDLKSFIKKYGSIKNIIVVGYKPYMAIPDYIQAADVLVLPNSLRSTNPRLRIYSQFDTSPIKMFEYMASGRPIIAVDLPAIKEVLNDQNATLFNHDDHNDLAQKIIEVLKDYSLAEEKALVAQHQSVDFTWGKRVEKIINFINTK
jgi:glycosyltransferase involved in cell wall biosynthesis